MQSNNELQTLTYNYDVLSEDYSQFPSVTRNRNIIFLVSLDAGKKKHYYNATLRLHKLPSHLENIQLSGKPFEN